MSDEVLVKVDNVSKRFCRKAAPMCSFELRR